jgi:hypothetical protein
MELEELAANDIECFDDERLSSIKYLLDATAVPYLHASTDDESSCDELNGSLSSIDSESDDDLAQPLASENVSFALHPSSETSFTISEPNVDDRSQLFDSHHRASVQADDSKGDPAKAFGFTRFKPPPHIILNTPPWLGKDDDIHKIKEVCNDVHRMTDTGEGYSIWGVDQNIAGSHMKLEHIDAKFKRQIRQVPVLHLTKQKIVNMSSAYKKAGVLESDI